MDKFWEWYHEGNAFSLRKVNCNHLVAYEAQLTSLIENLLFRDAELIAYVETNYGYYRLDFESASNLTYRYEPVEANFKVIVNGFVFIVNNNIIARTNRYRVLNRGDLLTCDFEIKFHVGLNFV